MISDKAGKKLHDKYTSGKSLTAHEQEQLVAWYEQRDASEAQDMLGHSAASLLEQELQHTLELTHQKLAQLTSQLKKTEHENDRLRAENRVIRQQLEKLLVQEQA